MVTNCPRCQVRLYINVYPEKKTLLKLRCPECHRALRLWAEGWTLPQDDVAALASLAKHKEHLDRLVEDTNEIEEMFEALQMNQIWDDRSHFTAHGRLMVEGRGYIENEDY